MSQLHSGRKQENGSDPVPQSNSGMHSALAPPSAPIGPASGTLWDESGFPRRYKAFNVDSDAMNERWRSWQRQIASQLLTQGSTWFLIGPSRTGKTQLATECARAVCQSGQSSFYLPFIWLALELDSTSQPAATQTSACYFRKLLSPSLLVLDDISLSSASSPHLIFLFNLIILRHDHCLDTLVLSRDNFDSFTSHFHSSALSRSKLNDGIIHASWPSF